MKFQAIVHTTEGIKTKEIVRKRPVGREDDKMLYVAQSSDGMFLTGYKGSDSGENYDGKDFEFFQATEYLCRLLVDRRVKPTMLNMLHITKEDSPIF